MWADSCGDTTLLKCPSLQASRTMATVCHKLTIFSIAGPKETMIQEVKSQILLKQRLGNLGKL